jgi:hypothetical protein
VARPEDGVTEGRPRDGLRRQARPDVQPRKTAVPVMGSARVTFSAAWIRQTP